MQGQDKAKTVKKVQEDGVQPIIRRKKIIDGGGHHGGAWKVAYADFVTAMMAFFLLMWLLNATTEDQRKGLSDYFNPSIPISQISGGGTGALSGNSVFVEDTLVRDGTGGSNDRGEETEEGNILTEEELRAQAEEMLMDALSDESEEGTSDHMQVHLSSEGLVIELVELDNEPLFVMGSTTPSPLLISLLDVVAQNFSQVGNSIKIVGHTDGYAYTGKKGYSNWELSTDRANASRRLLTKVGLSASQIVEVSGKADTAPFSEDKYAPENRRISITLLAKKK